MTLYWQETPNSVCVCVRIMYDNIEDDEEEDDNVADNDVEDDDVEHNDVEDDDVEEDQSQDRDNRFVRDCA